MHWGIVCATSPRLSSHLASTCPPIFLVSMVLSNTISSVAIHSLIALIVSLVLSLLSVHLPCIPDLSASIVFLILMRTIIVPSRITILSILALSLFISYIFIGFRWSAIFFMGSFILFMLLIILVHPICCIVIPFLLLIRPIRHLVCFQFLVYLTHIPAFRHCLWIIFVIVHSWYLTIICPTIIL